MAVCLLQMHNACQSVELKSEPVLLDMMKTFEMMPSSGHLKPGERLNVQVKFVPATQVDCHVITCCNVVFC